jgi:hypothetical protein
MPRKPRESSGTGIYHVMLRGINRQDIFDDTEDYWTAHRLRMIWMTTARAATWKIMMRKVGIKKLMVW